MCETVLPSLNSQLQLDPEKITVPNLCLLTLQWLMKKKFNTLFSKVRFYYQGSFGLEKNNYLVYY